MLNSHLRINNHFPYKDIVSASWKRAEVISFRHIMSLSHEHYARWRHDNGLSPIAFEKRYLGTPAIV